MLIRQVHPKNALDRGLTVCSGCPDVLMTSTGISSIAILDIHAMVLIDCHRVINGVSKREDMNFLNNADLSEKSR